MAKQQLPFLTPVADTKSGKMTQPWTFIMTQFANVMLSNIGPPGPTGPVGAQGPQGAASTVPGPQGPAGYSPSNVVILSGDVTGTGNTGTSIGTTLSTVNSNVGVFGDISNVPIITVNAKGLITAINTAPIVAGLTTAQSFAAVSYRI